jgi:hypothetical protein
MHYIQNSFKGRLLTHFVPVFKEFSLDHMLEQLHSHRFLSSISAEGRLGFMDSRLPRSSHINGLAIYNREGNVCLPEGR